MKTLQLYQTIFCFGQIISIDSNSFGVGLSINQLNDIKHQFDQVNDVKSKAAIHKGIYQNKYHNFSEKFSLEDRLLLVRLYNRYTEENCMTFKTFARKFKKNPPLKSILVVINIKWARILNRIHRRTKKALNCWKIWHTDFLDCPTFFI